MMMNQTNQPEDIMTYSDYKIGDTLLLTYKMKSGYDTRIAEVFDINYNGNGLVTYVDRYGNNLGFMTSGSGAFDPKTVGKKPFGLVAVEKF